MKKYRELILLPTFESRYEYLKLGQSIGIETFGFDRYLNQDFYASREWRNLRNYIITRDCGLDMALEGNEIGGSIVVHHINPISAKDIESGNATILDPENLVCVSERTHKAIHYGDKGLLLTAMVVERAPFDTCPWKTKG